MPLSVREDVRGLAGSELDGVSAHADVDIEQAFNQLQGKVISLEHNIYNICWRKLEYLSSVVCRVLNFISEYDMTFISIIQYIKIRLGFFHAASNYNFSMFEKVTVSCQFNIKYENIVLILHLKYATTQKA